MLKKEQAEGSDDHSLSLLDDQVSSCLNEVVKVITPYLDHYKKKKITLLTLQNSFLRRIIEKPFKVL